jgi:hypothetical protein
MAAILPQVLSSWLNAIAFVTAALAAMALQQHAMATKSMLAFFLIA